MVLSKVEAIIGKNEKYLNSFNPHFTYKIEIININRHSSNFEKLSNSLVTYLGSKPLDILLDTIFHPLVKIKRNFLGSNKPFTIKIK